ncbi:hypothetical protein Clacol_009841 [Clathrus columnatus]|uniref:Transcription factor CBF/NF-Y/archaeal histone domain-containing protein n=1 Tax=Clathrus columnatus TaxID=1419009 RepID=A0AAV5ARB1_9AGAM|nr:hypothetical protein Clacol_009841 [Clathrus columnatus]
MSNILRIPPRRPPPPSAPMDIDVPQIVTINQVTAPSSEIDYEDDYVTDDEEVDQIIDDEPIDPPPSASISPRKLNGKGKARAVHIPSSPDAPSTSVLHSKQHQKSEQQIPRLPPRKEGETYVDQQRVEKIMKAYGDILPPSKDAVFLVSLATQEFIQRLIIYGSEQAKLDKRDIVEQEDLETIPCAIPLSTALAKRIIKENERILIATELVPLTSIVGSSSIASTSHKKRQPPLPKSQAPSKGKTRTSARQANGRLSLPSTAPTSSAIPRPKRAAAQKGRASWTAHEREDEDEKPTPARSPISTPVGDESVSNGLNSGEPPSRPISAGRGGIMKGFGPGAYGKFGGLYNGGRSSATNTNGQDAATHPKSWNYPQESPRNTGRTIYSDRTDEEARKAAVEAEEQLRFSRVRQKIEQELMVQDRLEEHTDENIPIEGNDPTDNHHNPMQ